MTILFTSSSEKYARVAAVYGYFANIFASSEVSPLTLDYTWRLQIAHKVYNFMHNQVTGLADRSLMCLVQANHLPREVVPIWAKKR